MLLALVSIASVAGWATWSQNRHSSASTEQESFTSLWWQGGAYILLYGAIVATYALSRSSEALISPWQVVTPWCIPLFALTGLLTWVYLPRMSRWMAGILTMLQGIAAFGISMVVYRFGYGFDPFIHQAAARSLAEHGQMLLSSPLYVGYYTLLAGMHYVTAVPVDMIDIVLVPLFMTMFLVWWTVCGTALWRLPRSTGWLVLLLPYAFATFSVPYHLALVLLLWIIALLPLWEEGRYRFAMVLLASVSVLIHPLTAVPLAMMLVAGALRPIVRTRYRIPLVALGTLVGISVLFWIYVSQGGGAWIMPTAESLRIGVRVLLGLPFFYEPLPTWMWLVWNGQMIWMWLALFVAAIGWGLLAPKEARVRGWEAIAVMIGTAFAAILVASSASFTNILPSEQYEFALRLRNLLPWLLFPGLSYAALRIMEKLWGKVSIILVVPLLFTANWLASYPAYAPEMSMVAPGLGEAQLQAFEAAELMAERKPYAALAPQMVSAASLKRVGFERSLQTSAGERYPYAIPTGGELYSFYLQLWSERDPHELLQEACQFARVPQVLVIMPSGWDPSRWIDERLSPMTTRWITEDMQHRVYRYECR